MQITGGITFTGGLGIVTCVPFTLPAQYLVVAGGGGGGASNSNGGAGGSGQPIWYHTFTASGTFIA